MGYQTWVDDTTSKAFADLQKTISGNTQDIANSFVQRSERLRKDNERNEAISDKRQEIELAQRIKANKVGLKSNGIDFKATFDPAIKMIGEIEERRLKHQSTDDDMKKLAVLYSVIDKTSDQLTSLGAQGQDYADSMKKGAGQAGAFSVTNYVDGKLTNTANYLRAATNFDPSIKNPERTLQISLDDDTFGETTWGVKAQGLNYVTNQMEDINSTLTGTQIEELTRPGGAGFFTKVPDFTKDYDALIESSSGPTGVFYSKEEADKMGNPALQGKFKDDVLDKSKPETVTEKGDNESKISYETYAVDEASLLKNTTFDANLKATIASYTLSQKQAIARDIGAFKDCSPQELDSVIRNYYLQTLTKDRTPNYNKTGSGAGIVTTTIAAQKDKYGRPLPPKNPRNKTGNKTGDSTTPQTVEAAAAAVAAEEERQRKKYGK